MSFGRSIPAVILLMLIPAVAFAQQPSELIAFGSLRVPACSAAPDPEYGLVVAKPIQIGGGPLYASARMTRYIGALRGPGGQPLRFTRRGSVGAPAGYWDDLTFLDTYQVSYENQEITLYVDTYHFSLPKAPAGLTCFGPLVTALGMPPLDPIKLGTSLVALAIEQGSVKDITPITLDPGTPRGYLVDQFTLIARRARAATVAGMPLDPSAPPRDLDPSGLVVVAHPIPCGARNIAPQNIEMFLNQAAVPPDGNLVRDDAVGKLFAGVLAPAGSLGGRFRQTQATQVKIAYAESCDGAPAEVLLNLRIEQPRLIVSAPAALPQGIVESDPTVYLQTIIDTEGRFTRPVHIGGPRSLLGVAINTINSWRAEPLRVNGNPTVNPVVLQVTFR